jgi:hypothetical protein
MRSIQSKELCCKWHSWSVLGKDALALEMPRGQACDMYGAIGVATSIMPTVRCIETYVDGVMDTIYERPFDKWEATIKDIDPTTIKEVSVLEFDLDDTPEICEWLQEMIDETDSPEERYNLNEILLNIEGLYEIARALATYHIRAMPKEKA